MCNLFCQTFKGSYSVELIGNIICTFFIPVGLIKECWFQRYVCLSCKVLDFSTDEYLKEILKVCLLLKQKKKQKKNRALRLACQRPVWSETSNCCIPALWRTTQFSWVPSNNQIQAWESDVRPKMPQGKCALWSLPRACSKNTLSSQRRSSGQGCQGCQARQGQRKPSGLWLRLISATLFTLWWTETVLLNNQRKQTFSCYCSNRDALSSTLTSFFPQLFQGGGQSTGDGPQHHL